MRPGPALAVFGLAGTVLAFAVLAAAADARTPSTTAVTNAVTSAGSSSGITLTTVNDGHPVSLLDPAHPAWADVGVRGALTMVVASFASPGPLPGSWSLRLEVRNSAAGNTAMSCNGSEVSTHGIVNCSFGVAVALGVNVVDVALEVGGTTIRSVSGNLHGGVFGAHANYEVLDASGQWTAIAPDQTVTLPSTTLSALRYVVSNDGTIPVRLLEGCDTRLIQPHGQLTCPLRGVRSAESLAGEYRQRLTLRDVAGVSESLELRTGIASFNGTFTLSTSHAVVGQQIVITSAGLPSGDAFSLEYRLDEQAVPIGTSTTHAGSVRYGFVLRGASPGPAHLTIDHDGVTIASLPFDVTRTPATASSPAALWGLIAVPVAALVCLLVWRRLRARRRASAPTDAAAS